MASWVTSLNPDVRPEQIRLVQLGANPQDFDVSRVKGTVVTVGKSEPRKGTKILLQALDHLKQSAYLAITSPLHTQLEVERLQEYADAGDHILTPFSPTHEDIMALLQSCHVAVFPACAEGWNLGLTEALAQGCVVVASDISAHRYQYKILCDGVGKDEADRRMVLVPTKQVPMTYHQRWYPPQLYPKVQWNEPSSQDVADAIQQALSMPVPRDWETNEFPLSWTSAAECLNSVLNA